MMNIPKLLPALALASAVAFGSNARADVYFVSEDGTGTFNDLPAAVAAANDGDVIVVKSGRYTGFTIANKALDIVAEEAATVQVRGLVTITNLGSARSVTLSGMVLRGPVNTPPNAVPALRLTNNLGTVRIQGCDIAGRAGISCNADAYGGPGVELVSCFDVAFARCTILGGQAGNFGPIGHGGYGGDALNCSNTRVAVYESMLVGGEGASSSLECGGPGNGGSAGPGGSAARILWSPTTYFARTFLIGGPSGESTINTCPGSGLWLFGNSTATTIESTPVLGAIPPSGTGSCTPQDTVLSPGTSVTALPVTGRILFAKRIIREGSVMRVEIAGEAGDQVELYSSERGGFTTGPGVNGVNLLPSDGTATLLTSLTLPASGTARFMLPIPPLPAGSVAKRSLFQALIRDVAGRTHFSTPATVVVLDSTL